MVASALSLIVAQRLAEKIVHPVFKTMIKQQKSLLQFGFKEEELSTFKPKKVKMY